MNTTDNLNALNLFKNENKNQLIFHIPHASITFPNYDGYYNLNLVNEDIIKLTDWATDLIFNVADTDKIIVPYSRVYCDVERFGDDKLEIMSKVGRGFYYTKTDSGEKLRNNKFKTDVKKIYDKHHIEFTNLVENKLNDNGIVTIIDCHSYSNTPFITDLIKDNNRPDICLGVDEYHTPKYLVNQIKLAFENNGYSVEIDNPYSGTIVPLKYYHKNKNVKSIMIEINRKLYMDITEKHINVENVIKLNILINKIFNFNI